MILKETLIDILKKENIIIKGEFILKSGKKSKYYVDFRKLISKPEIFCSLTSLLGQLLPNINIGIKNYYLCGLPYAGIPYCVHLAMGYKIPMIMLRKEQKKYGTKKMIEGNIKKNEEIVIIDDILTSGTSIIESLGYFKDYKIKNIIVILDRCEGGRQKLEDMGFKISSLFTIDDFIDK